MEIALRTVAYLAAAILFILSLRGLSSQETARKGNTYGVLGMAVAIVATLTCSGLDSFAGILIALVVGVRWLRGPNRSSSPVISRDLPRSP